MSPHFGLILEGVVIVRTEVTFIGYVMILLQCKLKSGLLAILISFYKKEMQCLSPCHFKRKGEHAVDAELGAEVFRRGKSGRGILREYSNLWFPRYPPAGKSAELYFHLHGEFLVCMHDGLVSKWGNKNVQCKSVCYMRLLSLGNHQVHECGPENIKM